jgi:hypothetical protein
MDYKAVIYGITKGSETANEDGTSTPDSGGIFFPLH